jgi:glutamate 5-kinase
LLGHINLDDKHLDLSQQLKSSSGLLGRGGMRTKIEAAKTSLNGGALTWVASGYEEDTLIKIFNNESVGTKISSEQSILQSRKLWISSFGAVAGTLILDEGACVALISKGKSLLPVGVVEVRGEFNKGDLIECSNAQGEEIARGLSNFNHVEMNSIKGLNSEEIKEKLEHFSEEEVIHRNNLVLD